MNSNIPTDPRILELYESEALQHPELLIKLSEVIAKANAENYSDNGRFECFKDVTVKSIHVLCICNDRGIRLVEVFRNGEVFDIWDFNEEMK